MSSSSFHLTAARLAALAWAAGALLMAQIVSVQPVRAETFVIAALDGYGIGDCLASGSGCGHVVADAWCEAHGMAHSTAFGRADDVTASIGSTASPTPAPGSYIVTCAP